MAAPIHPVIPGPLLTSIKNTFSIQASTPVQVLSVELLGVRAIPQSDVIAVIGLQSKRYSGTLALCFQKKTILGVINKMLGETYSEINEENADAAGELLNIVYASARVKFNEAGLGFEPAIPSVIRGSAITVSHGTLTQVTKISCKCDYGLFHVEVSLKSIS